MNPCKHLYQSPIRSSVHQFGYSILQQVHRLRNSFAPEVAENIVQIFVEKLPTSPQQEAPRADFRVGT